MGWKPRDLVALDTLDEWKPFFLAAREARLQGVPWMLDPLDFRLIGQVVRAKRGPLWTYVHIRTGGDLSVDDDGVPHHVKLDRAMRIRTKRIGMSPAVWRTGVPNEELARAPVHRATHDGWDTCEECQAWLDEEESELRPRRRKRASGSSRALAAPDADAAPVATTERHLRVVR